MDEYLLEINDLRRRIAKLKFENASVVIIEELEAQLRILRATYESATRLFSAGERNSRYPETDRAPGDRVTVARCATPPVAGGGLAPAIVAAAGLHRRSGEPRYRVCRRAPAGAVLWAVALHLGHPDRADPDLPDGRLLHRRAVGRPPARRSAALSVDRRSGPAHGSHPDRVQADLVDCPEWLRASLRPACARDLALCDRAFCRARDPARHGVALRDPASDSAAGNGRQRGGRRLRPLDAGQHPGHVSAGLLADPYVRNATDDICPRVSPGCNLDRRPL